MELSVPAEADASAGKILNEFGIVQRFILLAPGASCPARRYPIDRFAAVIRQLLSSTDLPVVVVGNQRERQLFERVLQQKRVVSLAGKISIPQLAAVVRRSALVIANDSGPMHIADAFQRPMVILYSGTEYESQWRPRNSPAILLRQPTDCSPCYKFQCSFNMECLDISPARVVESALGLLYGDSDCKTTAAASIQSAKEEDPGVCAPYVS